MASGLRIDIGGGSSLGARSALGKTGAATIAQTAYGQQVAPDSRGGDIETWHVFLGVHAAAIAWLVFLRWSLPTGAKKEG